MFLQMSWPVNVKQSLCGGAGTVVDCPGHSRGRVLFPADLGKKQDTREIETIMIANPYYVSSTFLNIFFLSLIH